MINFIKKCKDFMAKVWTSITVTCKENYNMYNIQEQHDKHGNQSVEHGSRADKTKGKSQFI
jgi:hypothetical protein